MLKSFELEKDEMGWNGMGWNVCVRRCRRDDGGFLKGLAWRGGTGNGEDEAYQIRIVNKKHIMGSCDYDDDDNGYG